MSKYPNCGCETTRFDYFRRRYRNGTLHLMRKCQECGKTGQNAMTQADYDTNWIENPYRLFQRAVGANLCSLCRMRTQCNHAQMQSKPNCKGISKAENTGEEL